MSEPHDVTCRGCERCGTPVSTILSGIVTNAQGGRQAGSDYFLRGLPALAVLRVGRILKEGARKYEADPYGDILRRNWHKISSDEHLEHLLTHVIKELMGDESEDHPGHIATRALFYLHQRLAERGEQP